MMVDLAAPTSGTERTACLPEHSPDERRQALCRQASGRSDWSRAGAEPSLAEVLEDPVVHLVLRRDGLTPSDLRRAMETARSGLRRDDSGDEEWRDQRG